MKPFERPVYVSRPQLPAISAYASGLQEIWDNHWLTNQGPILRRFREKLVHKLQAPHLALFSNGTVALTAALRALDLSGEVITTPFTYVATANAIVQAGLEPVFADVRDDITIDPDHVEALITPRTCAILAVHIFGHACAHEQLANIAARRGIKLIYDAAHAFGTEVGGAPIGNLGDISMFSFHATKIFHTVEGGALVFGDESLEPFFESHINQGLREDGEVLEAGTNAKMTEFHALMGELLLDGVENSIEHAHAVDNLYRERLSAVPGVRFIQSSPAGVVCNCSYTPILLDFLEFGLTPDQLKAKLAAYNVYSKRYFTPLISDLTAFRGARGGDALVHARKIADEVLVLPNYVDLSFDDVVRICELIAHFQTQAASR